MRGQTMALAIRPRQARAMVCPRIQSEFLEHRYFKYCPDNPGAILEVTMFQELRLNARTDHGPRLTRPDREGHGLSAHSIGVPGTSLLQVLRLDCRGFLASPFSCSSDLWRTAFQNSSSDNPLPALMLFLDLLSSAWKRL